MDHALSHAPAGAIARLLRDLLRDLVVAAAFAELGVVPCRRRLAPAKPVALHAWRQPLDRLIRQFVEEARFHVETGLAVQHALLRKAHVQTAARARDRHVHQAPFFVDTIGLARTALVREQAFFEARDEHGVEFEALGRVHRHQLQRLLPGLRLGVARFERCVRQERRQRRHHGGQRRAAIEDLDAILIHDRFAGLRLRRRAKVGRRLGAEAFFLHELGRGADHLLQVFDAVGAFFFVAVVRQQRTALEHHAHQFGQRQLLGLETRAFDQFDEVAQHGAGLARHVRHGRVQRNAVAVGRHLQLLDRARTDAARGEVHHAHEGRIVVRIVHQLQIGDRVLDLGALEVAQAAVHGIGNAGREQRMLDHAALRVAAVQDRDLVAAHALVHEALGFFDDPLRFFEIRRGLVHAHLFALAGIRAQVLAQALGVVGDQEVGAVEDVAMRAVVLLELDQVLDLVVAFERRHIADVGAAEGVDALVIVADGKDGAAARFALPRQQLEQIVLEVVGILELVDQDVTEAHLVVVAQRRVARQQLVRAQQQFGEIDDAFALALLVVQFIQLDHAALDRVVGLDLRRAQALVFCVVDEVHQRLGRVLFIVDVVRLEHALDQRKLVLRIENLERLRQRGVAVVRAQQPVAQAVEGADPHAPRVDRQHRRQAREHFFRGLVRERHRHDAGGRDLIGLDQPGNARGQNARLARTGAGQDQGALRRQGDGGKLFRIQGVEFQHPAIIPPPYTVCPSSFVAYASPPAASNVFNYQCHIHRIVGTHDHALAKITGADWRSQNIGTAHQLCAHKQFFPIFEARDDEFQMPWRVAVAASDRDAFRVPGANHMLARLAEQIHAERHVIATDAQHTGGRGAQQRLGLGSGAGCASKNDRWQGEAQAALFNGRGHWHRTFLMGGQPAAMPGWNHRPTFLQVFQCGTHELRHHGFH